MRNSILLLSIATVLSFSGFTAEAARPKPSATDLDGDGIPNIVDADVDNDGIPNGMDRNIDGGRARSGPFKGRYVGDRLKNDASAEKDADADGLADDALAEKDIDGDGYADDSSEELDIDGDGRLDDARGERDEDGDGRLDTAPGEDDIDGDGRDDDAADETDIDGDGLSDTNFDEDDIDGDYRDDDANLEGDIDGDHLDDEEDADTDGDGIPNSTDTDKDGDGLPDEFDVWFDATPVANVGTASGSVWQYDIDGIHRDFAVTIENAPAGDYDLYVNGVKRGVITVTAWEDLGDWEDWEDWEEDWEGWVEIGDFIGIDPIPPGTLISRKATVKHAGRSRESGYNFSPLPPMDDDLIVIDDPIWFDDPEVVIDPPIDFPTDYTSGTIYFSDSEETRAIEDALPLNFDPIDATIEIKQGSTLYYTATVPIPQPVVSPEFQLTSTNGVGSAGGEYEVFEADGPSAFLSLMIEAVPAGDYDVYVGGVKRGTLSAESYLCEEGEDSERTTGWIVFSTFADGADFGAYPLDFDPAGQTVEIKQGDTVFFTGTIPTPAPADGGVVVAF